MKKSPKVIIVGAGPVGCYLGQLLKHHGFNPLLLEEHSEIGKPVQCAGIVGRGLFEESRIPLSTKSILNTIDGARVFFNGSSFILSRPKVAYIIDREVFDKELSSGLNIEFNTELHDIHPIKDGYVLKTSNGEYYADLVIGADGPNSKVRKALDFSSDLRLYRGYQYRIKLTPENQNLVDVYYLKPFSWFTWVIPEGNGVARVGTITNNPYQDLNNFIESKNFSGEIVEKNAGAIPIGTCELVKGNAALVGDAAGQVKPITSGGIYYGMKSAEILAEAIKAGNLSRYNERWREIFGPEIQACLLLRYILESLDNGVSTRIFEYVKENASLIEKIGDFENHSSILWSLLSNVKTYSTVGATLLGLLKNPRFLLRSVFRSH